MIKMPRMNPSGEYRMERGNLTVTDMSEQDILDAQTFLERTDFPYNQQHITLLAQIMHRKRMTGIEQCVDLVRFESNNQLSIYRKAITSVCDTIIKKLRA